MSQTARDIEDRANSLYRADKPTQKLAYIAGATAERENTYGFSEWTQKEGYKYYSDSLNWAKPHSTYVTTGELFTLYLATK